MNDFFMKKTFNTPEVELLPSEGVLRIEGRSIPEDPGDFYKTIISILEEYYQNPFEITRLEIKLEYINSGSSKYLLELLRIVKNNYENGRDCIVNWHYEEDDESIQELGLHFQNTFRIPFKLIDYY